MFPCLASCDSWGRRVGRDWTELSWVISDVECPLCLLVIPISLNRKKYLFRLFVHFLIELFMFSNWIVRVLCIFWMSTPSLSDISFTNIFSPLVGFIFILLIISFLWKRFLVWCSVFCFSSVILASGDISKNIMLRLMSKSILTLFFLRVLWF